MTSNNQTPIKMKKLIVVFALTIFVVSISSCRPRYLRCNKSRRCEAPVKKVEQDKSNVLFLQQVKTEATR